MGARNLLSTAVVLGSILIGNNSQARCGYGTKCLNLREATASAATPEEAIRLQKDLVQLGDDAILSNCQINGSPTLHEVSGKICDAGKVSSHICSFTASVSCIHKSKKFDMDIFGACKGGLHDCGTFESCAKNPDLNFSAGKFVDPDDGAAKLFKPQGVTQ